MIESLFGYNIQNPIKNDEIKSKTPSPSKHVLDPKRLQNITILLKALNVTADQASDALIKGINIALNSSFKNKILICLQCNKSFFFLHFIH